MNIQNGYKRFSVTLNGKLEKSTQVEIMLKLIITNWEKKICQRIFK